MSGMNINDLTDEALLQIFALLDEWSIIIVMVACERWNELITAKTTLHAPFKLQLGSNYIIQESRLLEKFKYQKLKAMSIDSETDNKRQMEIFHRNKENIKEAEVSSLTWSFFEKDLIGMTNLAKLSLRRIEFNQNAAKLLMLNLKELEIDCSPDFLDVPNLVKLSLWGPRPFTEFLETCKKLTHLTYFMGSDEEISTELSAISPNLTFLDVHALRKTSIIPLLESQKTSMKELEIGSEHDEIEFAINQMRLEKLNIYVPSDLKALSLSKNSTIKELKLNYYKSGLQAIEKLIKSCSSTEKLIIDINSKDWQKPLMIASEFLPNLKHLVINGNYVDVQVENPPLNYIRTFDSLESMHLILHYNWNKAAYLGLFAMCPNLMKLKVVYTPCFGQDHNIEPIVSNELQRILDTVPDLHELIVDNVPDLEELNVNYIFMLSDDVIKILQNSKIRILKVTVDEKKFEEQQKLAVQLSKQSNIRCTIFSAKKFSLSA